MDDLTKMALARTPRRQLGKQAEEFVAVRARGVA